MSKPPYPTYEELVIRKGCSTCEHFYYDAEYSSNYSTCPCASCEDGSGHTPSTLAYTCHKERYYQGVQ